MFEDEKKKKKKNDSKYTENLFHQKVFSKLQFMLYITNVFFLMNYYRCIQCE